MLDLCNYCLAKEKQPPHCTNMSTQKVSTFCEKSVCQQGQDISLVSNASQSTSFESSLVDFRLVVPRLKILKHVSEDFMKPQIKLYWRLFV